MKPKKLAGWGAALLFVLGCAVVLFDAFTSDLRLRNRLAQAIQEDFLSACAQARETPIDFDQTSDKLLLFAYNEYGALVNRTGFQFAPSDEISARQLRNKQNEILHEKNRYYFNVKRFQNDTTYFVLIPLHISYPIKNEYLRNYIFLGDYSSEAQKYPEIFVFSTLPQANAANVYADDGRFVFSVEIKDVASFRITTRLLAITFIGLSIVLGLVWLWAALTTVVKSSLFRTVLVWAAAAAVRVGLWIFRLPADYVTEDLFSSRFFALDVWNPSLGDLTLNILLVCAGVLQILRARSMERINAPSHKWRVFALAAWGFLGGAGGYALYVLYLELFKHFALNSKIYYAFSEPARMDGFSFLFHFDCLLLLYIILRGQYALLKPGVRLTNGIKNSVWMVCVAVSVGVFSASGLSAQTPPVETAFFLGYANLLIFLASGLIRGLNFSFAQVIALFAGLALTTNFALARAEQEQTQRYLKIYAQKFASQRDLVLEYIFDDVLIGLQKDVRLQEAELYSRGVFSSEAILKIINHHLIFMFKGYDAQVFAFTPEMKRLDTQFELTPYRLTSPLIQRGGTLSENLYLFPSNKSLTKEVYVGRGRILVPKLGEVILQIELTPKTIGVGKLYPQLLLDEQVRQKLLLPQGYEIAVYYNGRLFQRIDARRGVENRPQTPLTLNLPIRPPAAFLQETDEVYQYIDALSMGRTVLIQATKRTLSEAVTAVSFLFYYYAALLLLVGFLTRRLRLSAAIAAFRHSLGVRIQFFLLFLALLPLGGIWFLTSSLFRGFYYNDTRHYLRQNLSQVASFLENEPAFLTELEFSPEQTSSSRDLLNRIGDLLSIDLNVYNNRGLLHTTTRPPIYQSILTSSYINPQAQREIADQNRSEAILTEKVGELAYLSGYVPLLGTDGRLKGVLNIPYLSQQDLLDSQIEKFTAYLINVYILLILIFTSVGIFISRGVTRPLEILQRKLEETNIGGDVTPLVWRSNDEIGALIKAYNQMLEKLTESEKRLAKNERELAWREMARQVAHEIKNPLTPMKLSLQHLLRLLKGTETTPAVEKISKTLLSQIDSLTAIANSFSQFAALPTDSFASIELSQLLSEIGQLYAVQEEGPVFSLVVPDGVFYVWGDKNQLLRALINIVRNALQATPPDGSVTLTLTPLTEALLITVKDTGAGVPPEIKHKIFEPNFSTKTSGMGLGLAITRRIIENMNGEISFESETGVGTTFYIRLPYPERMESA